MSHHPGPVLLDCPNSKPLLSARLQCSSSESFRSAKCSVGDYKQESQLNTAPLLPGAICHAVPREREGVMPIAVVLGTRPSWRDRLFWHVRCAYAAQWQPNLEPKLWCNPFEKGLQRNWGVDNLLLMMTSRVPSVWWTRPLCCGNL